MGLPMLPSRVSNIIGEWAWNPWQWGDVMPQRRRGGTKFQDDSVQDDRVSSTALSPQTSSLTWKFRRSSSNEIQLPEVFKESKKDTPEITAKFADATAAKLTSSDECQTAKVTETHPPPKEGSTDGVNEPSKSSEETIPTDKETKIQDKGTPFLKHRQLPPPEREEVSPQNIPVSQMNEISDNGKETNCDAPPQTLVLPLPPVTAKESPQPLTSLPLFGFFEKDKTDASASQEKSSENGNKDNSNGLSQQDLKKPLSPENSATIETFPSMLDHHYHKDYDFRDRRLDYTSMSVDKIKRSR